jgi:hypothetical protein
VLDRRIPSDAGRAMSASGTSIAPRRAERACRLVQWTPVDNNPSLIGRATIVFAGGWIVSAIPIFRRADGSLSAGAPSSAQLDADGHIKVRDGKRQYVSVISFETAEAKARWGRMVLGALAEAGIGAPAIAEAPQ